MLAARLRARKSQRERPEVRDEKRFSYRSVVSDPDVTVLAPILLLRYPVPETTSKKHHDLGAKVLTRSW